MIPLVFILMAKLILQFKCHLWIYKIVRCNSDSTSLKMDKKILFQNK